MFEIKHRDGLARIGKFEVHGKSVETPLLMPVINPNIIVISPEEIKNIFGINAIITNSYIIYKDKKLRERALNEGLKNMLNFDGIIMTDSGTFQSYVYGDVEIKNKEIVEFQKNIKSDIITILDIFSTPEDSYEKAKEAVLETYKRAVEAMDIAGRDIAGPIQGSIYNDLRKKSAEMMNSLDLEYYPIGGVVPLLESYRYSEIIEIIINSRLSVDFSKPIHLFGAGHPMFFSMAILLGIDFFDSSSYVKYARDKRIIFPDGTRYLKDIEYFPYVSPYIEKYTPKEIMEMEEDEIINILSRHNLYMAMDEIRRIKSFIREESLWEYVEERSRCHPSLYKGLKVLEKYSHILEEHEPIYRNHPVFYTGVETLNRPIFKLVEKRFYNNYNYRRKSCIIVDENDIDKIKKLFGEIDAHFLVKTMFGFIPYEYLYIYPFMQSPRIENIKNEDNLNEMIEHLDFDYLISWIEGIPENIDSFSKYFENEKRNADLIIRCAIADYQFGYNSCKYLFDGEIEFIKSKNTGMIRNILRNGKHILSVRNDGLYTLKIEGGKILHQNLKYPELRVVVSNESEEFNRKGKNVFGKFIIEMDHNLRPKDEVLIVNENDDLIGVGQTLFSYKEIKNMKKGMAVEIRETLS
ncbi:MAG: tRNA guanosine(15) transglycosylase TgtA [Thermoplasmata archaeon]